MGAYVLLLDPKFPPNGKEPTAVCNLIITINAPLWGPDVVRPGASAPTVVAEELPGLQGVKPSFGLASRSSMKWCRPSWFGRDTNLHAPGLGGRFGSVPLRGIAWEAPVARSFALRCSPCPAVLPVPYSTGSVPPPFSACCWRVKRAGVTVEWRACGGLARPQLRRWREHGAPKCSCIGGILPVMIR